MDFSNFKAPFISESDIKSWADKLRLKFWGDVIPVDIEKIIENNYGMSVVPSPNLYQQSGFDSFISSDWKYIYVDNNRYLDDFGYKRVRFSLAHELGHLILHKDLYEALSIKSLEDYYVYCETVGMDQYSYLETQANKFAGYFLVPREILKQEFEKIKKEKFLDLKLAGLNNIDDDILIGYMAESLAEIFNVSGDALQVCLNTKF